VRGVELGSCLGLGRRALARGFGQLGTGGLGLSQRRRALGSQEIAFNVERAGPGFGCGHRFCRRSFDNLLAGLTFGSFLCGCGRCCLRLGRHLSCRCRRGLELSLQTAQQGLQANLFALPLLGCVRRLLRRHPELLLELPAALRQVCLEVGRECVGGSQLHRQACHLRPQRGPLGFLRGPKRSVHDGLPAGRKRQRRRQRAHLRRGLVLLVP
jgi:hypothetical protein